MKDESTWHTRFWLFCKHFAIVTSVSAAWAAVMFAPALFGLWGLALWFAVAFSLCAWACMDMPWDQLKTMLAELDEEGFGDEG